MKSKLLIALGVLIVSGLVFAAVETKFYGNINLQNNKVVNMGTPTSNSDGANKAYVDTAISGLSSVYLPRTGGTMSGTIYMGTTHQIKNLADPTSAQDATTKAYVDLVDGTKLNLSGGTMSGNITMSSGSTIKGVPNVPSTDDTVTSQGLARYYYAASTNYASGKLSLSGGDMYGDISMGGHRITAMNDPQNDYDGANKRYVDSVINEANCYQYFALKKGSGFTPFYALDSNTSRWFEVVICKAFQGAITSYYERIATTNSTWLGINRFWNVGETLRIPFRMAQFNYSATNGTLIVKGGNGIVGNFGITAPSNALVPYPIVAVISGIEFAHDTSVDVSSAFDNVSKRVVFEIKNKSGSTIPSIYINFGKATCYSSPTEYSASASVGTSPLQTVPCQQIISNVADGATRQITLSVPSFDALGGLRWSFGIVIGNNSYNFGQFFIPDMVP